MRFLPDFDGNAAQGGAVCSCSCCGAAIEARNLTVRYTADGPVILDHISLALEPGQFYLLSGPSGGGKSTLLNALNGTLSVLPGGELSGEVLIDGRPASPDAALRAWKVGSVLQDANSQILFARVEDELAFPLENLCLPYDEMHLRVPHVAETLSLNLDAETAHLSGGQKQRLTTASTLGMGQKILLFDEPLASLDQRGADLLLRHLRKQVRESGYTVLFLEHRIDWVLPYADQFLWLDNAKLRSFTDAASFERFFSETVTSRLRTPKPLPPAVSTSEELLRLEHASFSVRMTHKAGRPASAEGSTVVSETGRRVILDDINFTLHAGDRYVIHGDNGAGKTTFLHLLAGLRKPTSGKYFCRWSRGERARKIGVVMQNPSYQLFLPTVEDELRFQAHSPEIVDRLIELFDFGPLLKRHPHSLSEGQKRRLGFAVILSMLPEVLFLDEPTVGQDYVSLHKLLHALSELYADRPLTLLTLTHDTRCGAFFGDRVIVIEDGKLREEQN